MFFIPDYFNSTEVDGGVGFEKIYYPLEYARDRQTYLTRARCIGNDQTYLFDGDLFNQNLAFIARNSEGESGKANPELCADDVRP